MGAIKVGFGLIGVGFCIGVGIYLSRKACGIVETAILEKSPWLQDKVLGKPAKDLAAQTPAAA